ncbi:DUF2867 domain-containing protein [bacterium]|nr:DUF2867 domain-containing protein [bacterium]
MASKQEQSCQNSDIVKQNWLVDEIAHDFEFLDRWDIQLEIDEETGDDLNRILDVIFSRKNSNNIMDYLSEFLFWFRDVLGTWFGWDKAVNSLPIPGCQETSLKERFLKISTKPESIPEIGKLFSDIDQETFKTVYNFENERLLELSNNTVHALLHFGRLKLNETQLILKMSVYVKTRGLLGKFYMKLITPFRHLIIYPTLIQNAQKNWENFCNQKK